MDGWMDEWIDMDNGWPLTRTLVVHELHFFIFIFFYLFTRQFIQFI